LVKIRPTRRRNIDRCMKAKRMTDEREDYNDFLNINEGSTSVEDTNYIVIIFQVKVKILVKKKLMNK